MSVEGWKIHRFTDSTNLSRLIKEKCIVILDGYDYKEEWDWRIEFVEQMFLGMTECSAIMPKQ